MRAGFTKRSTDYLTLRSIKKILLRKSKAESAMAAMMTVAMARSLLEVLDGSGLQNEEDRVLLEKIVDEGTKKINKRYWDNNGHYYVAGFDDDGRVFGTSQDNEGALHLLPQTWAIISGVAQESDRVAECVNAIAKLSKKPGLLLFYPPYDTTTCPLGCINFYVPYFKENGGCFNHAAAMGITALLMAGEGKEAYTALRANLPPAVSKDNPYVYGVEPYVWSQIIGGQDGEYGGGGP